MGEPEELYDEVEVTIYHQQRWLDLCELAGGHKQIHPGLSGHKAMVIERILHRLGKTSGQLSISIEELEHICVFTSRSTIYRAIRLIEDMGFCRVNQKRRGGLFRFMWSDSYFDQLETKTRMSLKVVPIRRRS